MAILGIILFGSVIIGLLQTVLSSRKNKFYGLIIPIINIILSTFFAMKASDFFIAFFVLFTTLIPIVLWLSIYKLCRFKIEKSKLENINKMTIKEL